MGNIFSESRQFSPVSINPYMSRTHLHLQAALQQKNQEQHGNFQTNILPKIGSTRMTDTFPPPRPPMFHTSTPDCLPEVITHPVGLLDHGFSVVLIGPGVTTPFVPKFHVTMHASHASNPRNIFFITRTSQVQNSSQTLTFLCCKLKRSNHLHIHLLHFTTPYLVSSLFQPQGRAGTDWEPSEH